MLQFSGHDEFVRDCTNLVYIVSATEVYTQLQNSPPSIYIDIAA